MSNTRNLHLFLLEKFLNHDITVDKLRHCKRPDFLRISEFMASKSFLLTLPILDLAGLISLHFGLLMKLGLWSLNVINASFFVSVSILFSSFNFFAIALASLLIFFALLGSVFRTKRLYCLAAICHRYGCRLCTGW